jgi:hypothetical protein
MEYYSVIKKNEIMLSTSKRMELESIMLSEVSEIQKDNGLICGRQIQMIDIYTFLE